MKRRKLIKGFAAAGLTSSILGPGRSPSASTDKGGAIVVDGLAAGTIRDSYFEGMKKAGVHCVIAGGPSDVDSWNKLLKYFDEHSGELVHATTVADIRKAHAEGKYSNVFCWQMSDMLGQTFNSPIGSSATNLRAFKEMGLRVIGLCYNVANYFGGGNLEAQLPLTRAGRRLVEEIHELNLVLDLGGHTGEQTTLDAIAMAPDIPVICTHTNVAAIANNYRCVSDRVIDAIASTGGVIGLTIVNDFHVRSRGNHGKVRHANIEDHADQYDYIKNRVGAEHVGMGTDSVEGMPIPYGSINTDIIPTDMVDEPWRFIDGFSKIEEFPALPAALKRRGWTPQEIDLAMGGNWLRVYEEVWGG
jgi:membrane dipeptidase